MARIEMIQTELANLDDLVAQESSIFHSLIKSKQPQPQRQNLCKRMLSLAPPPLCSRNAEPSPSKSAKRAKTASPSKETSPPPRCKQGTPDPLPPLLASPEKRAILRIFKCSTPPLELNVGDTMCPPLTDKALIPKVF
jgi:hypothetical protein